MKEIIDKVTALLETRFETEEEYRDFFIVDIKMTTPNRMEVCIVTGCGYAQSQATILQKHRQKSRNPSP